MIRTDILIIGAGFSGLGMGIRLKQAGFDSFLILEKSSEIGGTWNENRYPGCACDIPSHLYSFSFDLNPGWSRMWSGQQEIQDYLKRCAARYGIEPRIRFNTCLTEAAWSESTGRWEARLSDGSTIEARVVVSGMGPLHIPNIPRLPGLEQFQGPVFHSAQWRTDAELAGKRVAVIGTGASAIQFVPEIAPVVDRLYLFQRTPAWILPRMNFAIPEACRRLFHRAPLLMWLFRKLIFLQHEMLVFGFLGNRAMRRWGERQAKKHLASQVADAKLRALLTPDYELGCKRVLASNTFYPALTRPNAELVTSAIESVGARSIRTADGKEREVDAIIFGTGFLVAEPFRGTRVLGRGGVEIHDAWRERVSAYLGITVAGFPNFFLLLGPNTGLGHNSVVLMIEAQIRYVISCLKLMERRGCRVMEVDSAAQARFAAEIRTRLARTVWQSGGCRSWYQDERGENPTIWPGSVSRYVLRTRSASAGDYRFT